MRTKPTFDGFSAITFYELGMRVHVSRSHRTAGVFTLTGKPVGALMRKPDGCLDWEYCRNDRPCPVEIFDVVHTMI